MFTKGHLPHAVEKLLSNPWLIMDKERGDDDDDDDIGFSFIGFWKCQ